MRQIFAAIKPFVAIFKTILEIHDKNKFKQFVKYLKNLRKIVQKTSQI